MYKVSKTLGALLALIAAIAIFGVVYAMWSETLRVNVVINTGEVDVAWDDWWDNDTLEKPGLDVTTVDVSSELTDDEGDVIKLKVTIDDAYPCYKVGIYGKVKNVGSIPVKLLSAKIKYDTTEIPITLCTWQDLDLDGDGKADINVHLELAEDGGDGTQIDPDDTDTYELCIHVKQDAKENSSYSFELILEFAQWNEVP